MKHNNNNTPDHQVTSCDVNLFVSAKYSSCSSYGSYHSRHPTHTHKSTRTFSCTNLISCCLHCGYECPMSYLEHVLYIPPHIPHKFSCVMTFHIFWLPFWITYLFPPESFIYTSYSLDNSLSRDSPQLTHGHASASNEIAWITMISAAGQLILFRSLFASFRTKMVAPWSWYLCTQSQVVCSKFGQHDIFS